MQNKKFALLIFLFVAALNLSEAQEQINSPYARFNIGTLSNSGNYRGLSMGGTGIGMRDNNALYYSNPASYTSIDTASFVFDFGAEVAISSLNDGTDKFDSYDINFNHLLIGMPVTKRIGIAAGIVPLSNGYYFIAEKIDSKHPDYDPVTGEAATVHKGIGNFSKFFWGVGARPTRNLSVGMNMNFLLGELNRINQFEFSDNSSTFNQRGSEYLKISGINLDLGGQFHAMVGKDYFIIAGASYTFEAKYKSTVENLKERFSVFSSAPYSPDTLRYYYNESKDSTVFPATLRAGLSFGKTDKFTVGFDFNYTPWAQGMIHGDNQFLADVKSFRLGIEYIPDKYSNTSFLKRVEYRLGGYISDNYLKLNGSQLKDFGITAGAGIRLRESRSKATLYMEFLRRTGDINKGLHNENIFTIGLSLNLYDYWFIKRKYD